jgi:hypothetical protein
MRRAPLPRGQSMRKPPKPVRKPVRKPPKPARLKPVREPARLKPAPKPARGHLKRRTVDRWHRSGRRRRSVIRGPSPAGGTIEHVIQPVASGGVARRVLVSLIGEVAYQKGRRMSAITAGFNYSLSHHNDESGEPQWERIPHRYQLPFTTDIPRLQLSIGEIIDTFATSPPTKAKMAYRIRIESVFVAIVFDAPSEAHAQRTAKKRNPRRAPSRSRPVKALPRRDKFGRFRAPPKRDRLGRFAKVKKASRNKGRRRL